MKKLSILFLSLFLLCSLSNFATVINVPGDYSTIQAGITNAVSGDTVLVEAGTYNEKINFGGKAITVGSLFLTTGDESYIASTIINAGGNGSCAKFNSGEGNSSILCGFTLTNGGSYYGAGVNCYSASSPTLKHLIIVDNHGDAGDSYGGGLTCLDDSKPICDNVQFIGNSANEGGAVYCHYDGDATFNNCYFTDNTSAHGGAILTSYSDPIINYSVFYANNSPFGGAIYVFNYAQPLITNCTFVENVADYGGAIYCGDLQSEPIIDNSIFWDNEGYFDFQIFATSSTFPPIVTYSNIANGSSQFWFGEGCIDADPLFVDAAAVDFHLLENSPCIDTGNPDSPYDPDGTRVDMGAFYYDQSVVLPEMATTPTPENGAENIVVEQILSWINGANTTNIDLFLDVVNPPIAKLLDEVTAVETFDPELVANTTYYWRVTCLNEDGFAEGEVWSFTTEDDTNVGSISSDDNLTIYPNPVSTNLQINFNSKMEKIVVYNTLGVVVFNSNYEISNSYSLNVSTFENGTYFLRVTSGEMNYIKRFIVK